MFKIIVTCFLLAIFFPIMAGAVHYYNGSTEIPLYIDSTKLIIKLESHITPHELGPLFTGIARIDQVLIDDNVFDEFIAVSLISSVGYNDLIDSLRGLPDIEMVEPYYMNSVDSVRLVGTTICVQFHATITGSEVDSILSLYGGVPIYPFGPSETIYAIKNTASTGMGTLELANIYNNLDESRYAHPEFSTRVTPHSYNLYDYYSNNNDHIKKVIGSFNNKSVWDFAFPPDKDVFVAVIDDGVEPHEDLDGVMTWADWDYYHKDPDASPGPLNGHGMAIAGIIAANHTTDPLEGQETSTGVISMAPATWILPIKIASDNGTWGQSMMATHAIRKALRNGVDVISCSWGYGAYNDEMAALSYILDSAYTLGVAVIASSGNWAVHAPGLVSFPASHNRTIAVGASTLNDYRWDYSQYGPELDLVAPSGKHWVDSSVWTIDRMGTPGYNPNNNDYLYDWNCGNPNDVDINCNFDGTSAAAPIVSGTVALILSFDDTLGVDAVYDILRNSAVREVGGTTITPPDLEYGYGRVDAFRAILSLARGDMNSNGKINLEDINILISQVYNQGRSGFPDIRLGNCDCDAGGLINMADITKLIDHVYISKAPLPLPCYDYLYPNQ